MTFIDFKAAFDSVNRNAIWQIFERLGMPQKIANIIRNMYTDTNSIVKMNNNLSDPFPVCSGVRQGGVLSPFLFNLLIDWVMHTATEGTNHGIRLETLITDLDYADDICLLEDNSADAQALLDRSKKWLIMSLISNVYSFKFFIDSLGCLCSKEEVGRMPRRCAATIIMKVCFEMINISRAFIKLDCVFQYYQAHAIVGRDSIEDEQCYFIQECLSLVKVVSALVWAGKSLKFWNTP